MNFVIFDLEWNNVYNSRTKKMMNEIIEIGAVIIDESLEIIDTFDCFVRPHVGKKLSGRTKDLTHITNDEVNQGYSFENAINNFKEKIEGLDPVFMSWGDCDNRELFININEYKKEKRISFINRYMDLQKYCRVFLDSSDSCQPGLTLAAEKLGVDISEYQAHRGIDDSEIAYLCFKKIYDPYKIGDYIVTCDYKFFERMFFKDFFVTDLKQYKIDKKHFKCRCVKCGSELKPSGAVRLKNKTFTQLFRCDKCNLNIIHYVQIKKTYDNVLYKEKDIVVDSKKLTKQ